MFLIFLASSLKPKITFPSDFPPFCVNYISTISQPKAPKKVEICIIETKTLCHSSTEQP